MTVDIILVKYKQREFEDTAIRSVLANTYMSYNLTVYDNAPLNHNLGQLWNRLIGRSECDYICLLNTDTLVEPEWIEKLIEVLEQLPDAGVVGPTTSNSKNHQSKEPKATEKTVVDYGATYPNWCLSGFCIVFPKRVWELVGGFPEDFGFYGQEVAFIDRIVNKGLKQYWRKDVFVEHFGGASIKSAQANGEIDETKERKLAREKFYKLRLDRL